MGASEPIHDYQTYLHAELERLDMLLHRQILRLRGSYQLSLDEFRGLYVSDQQVDALIGAAASSHAATPDIATLNAQAEELREANRGQLPPHSPWQSVVGEFRLSPPDEEILLLALAPEIDPKYETLFAYLNNDVTRRHPTVDLALRLFTDSREGKWRLRSALHPESCLFRSGLLRPLTTPSERPAWLNRGFHLAPPAAHFLTGLPPHDEILADLVRSWAPQIRWGDLLVAPPLRERLKRLPSLFHPEGSASPTLIFEGHRGAGRLQAAEALAHALGLFVLELDLERAAQSREQLPTVMQRVRLLARLRPALLYLSPAEALFDKEGRARIQNLYRFLAGMDRPVVLACRPGTSWRELLPEQTGLALQFEEPGYPLRLQAWRRVLDHGHGPEVPEALADRFRLNPGQIGRTVATATALDRLAGATDGPSADALFQAARNESDSALGRLAVRVRCVHDWNDLVLPEGTLQRVKEIAEAIAHRHIVYSEWGFERRLPAGTGLKILFSGASGTGKTMTAGVIARDLGLDLFKIDLSAVVSKYIGETEKNLEQIFRAARQASALLFFDEADALFGKRSEVKDAHDRYANIEVAYLLQKMEDHDGVVILATNLSRNIDQAFSRRLHFTVEFPRPDAPLRERIWRGMFPPEAPIEEDVDFPFLGRQFELSGGDIKTVVLDAAFLAASNGRRVTMEQIVKATARQMISQGKIPTTNQFQQYHVLIAHQP